MKNFINTVIGTIGGVISYLIGGLTMAMQALIIFMIIDYVTGLIVAFVFHNSPKTETGGASSKMGYKGLCKKVAILFIVVSAHFADLVLKVNFIRDAVICGYCANELLSVLENVGLMGVYIPKPLKKGIDLLQKMEDRQSDNTINEGDIE